VNEARGTLRILKLAAAQRQLDAAIRMTFADEDSLAITTVAAAAYGILRNIAEKRGRKVLAEEWRDGVLGVARALARGTLAKEEIDLFKKADAWPVIVMLAEEIRTEGADRKISELRSIVDVAIPTDTETRHWRAATRVPNFLKHADRDYDASLSEGEIQPASLILAACNLYFDLIGRITPEMRVWSLNELHVNRNLALAQPNRLWERMIKALRSAGTKQRGSVAMELIAILKNRGKSGNHGREKAR
jgi:hypothetical protein